MEQMETKAGSVTLTKLQSGYRWDVTVPSTGPSLEEMRAAAQTAETISDAFATKYRRPAPKRAPVAEDGVPY